MKSLIIFGLVSLSIFFNQTNAETDLELDAFGIQGISIKYSNGTVSEHTSFMASIRLISHEVSEKFGYGHFCGGVFLSRQHILTLASCLSRSSVIAPNEIQVIGGTRYRYDDTYAQKFLISRYSLHPDYSITDLGNNVAILFLAEQIREEFLTISTILISHTPATIGQNLQIFGWGTPLVEDGPRELLTGSITIANRTHCVEPFATRFCAGPGFYGGCQGDDGGAVISKGLLYGLIDYRNAEYCLDPEPAHLYVDVVAYREWIETTVFGAPIMTTTQGSSKNGVNIFLFITIAALLEIILK